MTSGVSKVRHNLTEFSCKHCKIYNKKDKSLKVTGRTSDTKGEKKKAIDFCFFKLSAVFCVRDHGKLMQTV